MRTRTLRGSLTQSSAWQLGLAFAVLNIGTFALAASGCATGSSGGGDDHVGDDDVPLAVDAGLHDPDADLTRPDAAPGSPDAKVQEHADADVPESADASIPPPADPDLIDNLDDGNDHIALTPTRRGSWYTFHDATAGAVQVPGDAAFTLTMGGSTTTGYYVHTTGHGFTDWGAGVGFDLNAGDSGPKGKFNAGTYTGISFKAKGNVTIRVSVQIAAVLETTLGGTCVPSTVAGMECDDVHGMPVALTTSWQTYQVPFASLAQEHWGLPATFDKATLTAVSFQTLPGATFDVSIDDIRFY